MYDNVCGNNGGTTMIATSIKTLNDLQSQFSDIASSVEKLIDLQTKFPSNTPETKKGDLCVALFFPDPIYYFFYAEEADWDDSDFVCECDDQTVGFDNTAFYWHTFGDKS